LSVGRRVFVGWAARPCPAHPSHLHQAFHHGGEFNAFSCCCGGGGGGGGGEIAAAVWLSCSDLVVCRPPDERETSIEAPASASAAISSCGCGSGSGSSGSGSGWGSGSSSGWLSGNKTIAEAGSSGGVCCPAETTGRSAAPCIARAGLAKASLLSSRQCGFSETLWATTAAIFARSRASSASSCEAAEHRPEHTVRGTAQSTQGGCAPP
jgi:hypothetical protein